MTKLWIRVVKHHRIAMQCTVPCAFGEQEEALREALHEMDIAAPLWLNKHEREFADFRHTAFLPEHFMEEIRFDRLEIEFIDDAAGQRKSSDPRNQFDGL